MRYKKVLFLIAPLLFLLLCLTQPAFSQGSAKCLVCHSAMKGRLQSPAGPLVDLHVSSDKFQASVHGSLSCTDCHMKFTDNPHVSPGGAVPADIQKIASEISAKYPVDSVAAAACSQCHPDIYEKVLRSVHGQNIVVKHQTDAAFCLDCHGSPHYIVPVKNPASPVSRANMVKTCGNCHGNATMMKKYGIDEDVIGSFEESFHGRKLALGDTRAPVCSSCHKAHDIEYITDPASPVFGKNKLKTCGQCHKGANEKFIPAFTHKLPGPIPHYAEKALIVLLLSVFTFIVVHVLIEAFSDIRDAIFRRGREK
jgi:hypothetical protein